MFNLKLAREWANALQPYPVKRPTERAGLGYRTHSATQRYTGTDVDAYTDPDYVEPVREAFCSRCVTSLPVTAFQMDPTRGTPRRYCKSCQSAYDRERYLKRKQVA